MGRRPGPRPPVRIDGAVAFIPLTRGYETMIDADLLDIVGCHAWYAQPATPHGPYAVRTVGNRRSRTWLHRFILDADPAFEVDHINLDPLDNRRANLRLCTRAQNEQNKPIARPGRSGFRGVAWESRRNSWRAGISFDSRMLFLGYFAECEAAARAYDEAARSLRGEFARLNFPLPA